MRKLWKKIQDYLDKHWATISGPQGVLYMAGKLRDEEDEKLPYGHYTISWPKPDLREYF